MICLLGGLTIHVPLQESEGAEGTWLMITNRLGTKGKGSGLAAEMSELLESSPFILFYSKIPVALRRQAIN